VRADFLLVIAFLALMILRLVFSGAIDRWIQRRSDASPERWEREKVRVLLFALGIFGFFLVVAIFRTPDADSALEAFLGFVPALLLLIAIIWGWRAESLRK
jgi:hypothetical protein